MRFLSNSAEETREIGRQLARLLPAVGVVLLIGDLGAGKTTLAKGIIEERGAAPGDDVVSPTYTLIHEYGQPVSVYHVDLYRLDTAEEVRGLGFEDLLESPALILIEWGERFPELLPKRRVEIHLNYFEDQGREIKVTGLASK